MSVKQDLSPLWFAVALALAALLAVAVDTIYSHPTDACESQWRREQAGK